jgi:site-specific recombinase XerD
MAKTRNKWMAPKRPLADSPAARYIGRLGPGSRRAMQQALVTIAGVLGGDGADPMRLRWEMLRRADTVAIRAELKARFAPATANKMLSALRGVLRNARDMGLLNERDYQTAASIEMIIPADNQPERQRPVGPVEVERLFAACTRDDRAGSRRDAAALVIFLSSGLRRAEAAMLDVADYDRRTGRLHIRGERPEYDRVVSLGKPARLAVKRWLEIRSDEPGPLLLPIGRGGLIQFRRMTDQAVYDILGRIARRAGLSNITSRNLRRAYVVSLIGSGRTLEEVQYLAGHASWVTTASYQQLADSQETEGYDVLNLPYHPSTVKRSEQMR